MGVPTRYMLLIPHMYTRKQDAETKKVLFCLLYLAEKQEKVKKYIYFFKSTRMSVHMVHEKNIHFPRSSKETLTNIWHMWQPWTGLHKENCLFWEAVRNSKYIWWPCINSSMPWNCSESCEDLLHLKTWRMNLTGLVCFSGLFLLIPERRGLSAFKYTDMNWDVSAVSVRVESTNTNQTHAAPHHT